MPYLIFFSLYRIYIQTTHKLNEIIINSNMNIKLIATLTITLLFFSSNSLLNKAALSSHLMDPYSFTLLRLLSGAVMLVMIIYFKDKKISFNPKKNWLSSFMLFVYAISFSYAYLSLDAGIGALILFAMVQITLIIFALVYKESLSFKKIVGLVISLAGLIYLLYPKDSFELSLFHSFLMLLAGAAWGIYTILGKNSTNAILHTADNFTKALVYVIIFYIFFVDTIQLNGQGIVLAVISGGITSALGYSLWYYLLPKLSIITSGSLQLLVPPISIFLSVLILGEPLSVTLILSTIVILGGILITIAD